MRREGNKPKQAASHHIGSQERNRFVFFNPIFSSGSLDHISYPFRGFWNSGLSFAVVFRCFGRSFPLPSVSLGCFLRLYRQHKMLEALCVFSPNSRAIIQVEMHVNHFIYYVSSSQSYRERCLLFLLLFFMDKHRLSHRHRIKICNI